MGIVEGARPRHLKASNKPGRVALVCRIISLRPFTAFIATHLGAELVQRHGAEHRDPLAEHPERYPHGALAALAPDPGITFGLELRNGATICHPHIKLPNRTHQQIVLQLGLETDRTQCPSRWIPTRLSLTRLRDSGSVEQAAQLADRHRFAGL